MTVDRVRKRSIRPSRRVLFAFVAALIGLSVLEGFARLWLYFAHPDRQEFVEADEPGLVYINNHKLPGGAINSLGAKGPEPDLSRPERILVVGDSVAFGVHLADADTFPRRLEQKLGRDATVVNAGTTGYNTWQSRANLLRLAPLVRPTTVVVQVCPNDRYKGHESVTWFAAEQKWRRFHFEGTELESWLYQYVGLAHVGYVLRSKMDRRTVQEQMAAYPPPLDWPGEWRDELAGLIRDASAAADRVVVLLVPTEDQLSTPVQVSDDEARAVAEREGAMVVDAIDEIRRASRSLETSESLYLPDDPVHLNAHGSEVVAVALHEALADSYTHIARKDQ